MTKKTKEELEREAYFKQQQAEREKRYKQVQAALRDHFPLIDLTAVTRQADRARTHVRLATGAYEGPKLIDWIIFGEAHLEYREPVETWVLKAYLPYGVTDFEHDSAYALQLGLIGVSFKRVSYHVTSLTGYIHPNKFDDFCVPPPGYNPMTHPKTIVCKHHDECKKKPHFIVPEGHYVPAKDEATWKKMRGMQVEIDIGLVREKSEE